MVIIGRITYLGKYIHQGANCETDPLGSVFSGNKEDILRKFYRTTKTPKAYPGQSLLELALVLPFLLFVIFGVLDLGRVFFSTITLISAAREGARYLSVYTDDVSNGGGAYLGTIQTAIREAGDSGLALSAGDITPSCTNIDDDPVHCDSGLPAVVTVSHDFELVLGWFLPSPITVERTAQMVVP